jgi:hypothetical protein
VDPELHAVRYAFDAAFERMCEAQTDDDRIAELSNLLHHLYRLRELCARRIGASFDATPPLTPQLRAARAASWVRNFDTHQLYAMGSLEDAYTDLYTAAHGALVWKPLSLLPATSDKYGRHLDYSAELESKPVLDTLRGAFGAMAGML